MASDDRLRELEEKYEDYKVYDNQGSKIGKVDDLFVDENDREEYIGVKMGFFGMRSTLIPMEIARVNEEDRTIEVSETKDRVKDAPNFDDDDDITTEYEERIRRHFGLETHSSSRGGYGATSASSAEDFSESGSSGTATGAAGFATDSTGEHGTTAETETHDRERSATDTEETRSADTAEHDSATTGATGASDRTADDDRETSSVGGSGVADDRDSGSSLGSEGSTVDEGESQGRPISRQTEETETYEEGGRTKIRRRVVREEVEETDEGTSR